MATIISVSIILMSVTIAIRTMKKRKNKCVGCGYCSSLDCMKNKDKSRCS